MSKNLFYLLCFFLLSNCVANSSALLGPVITGARTGSVYQATLSYGSGKIMNEFSKISKFSRSISFPRNTTYVDKEPVILFSYAVDNIEISDVLEPEPLP